MISLTGLPGLVWPTTTHSIKYLFSPHTYKPSGQVCLLKYWQLENTAGREDPDFSSAAAADYGRGPIMVRHLFPSVCRCLWLYTTHTALLQHSHILPLCIVVVYLKREINNCNPLMLLLFSIVGHLSRRPSSAPPAVRQLRLCVFTTQAGSCHIWGIFMSARWCNPSRRLTFYFLVALRNMKFRAQKL